MAALLTSLDQLGPEERAFRKFVATIVGFAGLPVSIVLAAIVFGLGQAAIRRAAVRGVWPYLLWGFLAALVIVLAMLVSGPRQSVVQHLPSVMLAAGVGAAAGGAFWLGAIRGTEA
jgi:hypothetical protein